MIINQERKLNSLLFKFKKKIKIFDSLLRSSSYLPRNDTSKIFAYRIVKNNRNRILHHKMMNNDGP